jgi:signal transduction histidine kinase
LESRLPGFLDNDSAALDVDDQEVLATYLRRIQDEAFRCKEITERLLDFSRIGEVERQATHLGQVVADVVDMVQHLGKYRHRQILFEGDTDVIAMVNSQEMKQVVLNLLTNALDSLETGGIVWIDLSRQGRQAVLTVRDNGCGMTEDVLEHLFEPFFTRRRDGLGTGLGLSITYRIVTDHGGQMTAESPGEGEGSVLKVLLPIAEEDHGDTKHAHVA